MNESHPKPEAPSWTAQDWRALAEESADALGAVLECDGGAYRLSVPPAEATAEAEAPTRKYFGGGSKPSESVVAEPASTVLASGASPAELIESLIARLGAGEPLQLRPADQPEAVHDLSPRLFAAYQVDGGAMHLAGCQLTDRPFVRVTRPLEGGRVEHAYFWPTGKSLPVDEAAALGFDRLTTFSGKPFGQDTIPAAEVDRISQRTGARATGVVWAKHAQCRLRFEIGDTWLDLPLAGWARSLRPAPVACPVTGRETFHLTSLADGTIVAAEEVGVCEQTQARALCRDMARCSVTGKSVLAELVEQCPVAGLPALEGEFEPCTGCGERVSRAVLVGGTCAACRNLSSVSIDDEVLAALLKRHPKLARWGRWRMAQTGEAAIIEGRRLLKRLRLTVGLEDGEVRRIAVGGPWGKPRTLGDAERVELLG